MATLVARAATRGGVSPATLGALLKLEDEFPDLTIPGERLRFARSVAAILDGAANAARDGKA